MVDCSLGPSSILALVVLVSLGRENTDSLSLSSDRRRERRIVDFSGCLLSKTCSPSGQLIAGLSVLLYSTATYAVLVGRSFPLGLAPYSPCKLTARQARFTPNMLS